MATPAVPTNFFVQAANGQILVSWSQASGATEYIVQRSLDNVTFNTVSTISGSPLATQYLDTSVSNNTQYWYRVAGYNGTNPSNYTLAASAVPNQTGEDNLASLRLQAFQRADRVNSQFVTLSEANKYINKAYFELYDLLITVYEDYYITTPYQFVSDGVTFQYPVPNGTIQYYNGITPNVLFSPPPFYKLAGVDMALNNATNGYVTVNKFNFIDRNNFVYPNTASTIYGVFNLQYRLMGNNLQFIPTPSAGQAIRVWYVPRLTELLADTDTTTTGISGWNEYIVVRAAKYILDKEESDTTVLTQELAYLKQRIEETAANRDDGQPDTISATRSPWNSGSNNTGYGPNGRGGFALALPSLMAHNQGYSALANTIHISQGLLGILTGLMLCAYFVYKNPSEFGGRVAFAWVGQKNRFGSFVSALRSHIVAVIKKGSKE